METKELIEMAQCTIDKTHRDIMYTTYDIISKNGKTFKLEITNDNKQKTMKLRFSK